MQTINKKTKIVATIGPKTESVEMLTKLASLGMNVARLNMSHGDHSEHLSKIKNIKEARDKSKLDISILLDLSGPKIRTGEYTTERINIVAGDKMILTSERIIGDTKRIYINYEKLPQEVKKGSVIFLDDGKKKLEVLKVEGNNIHCKIIVGGELKSRRGVNIPGAYLSIKSFTEKDKKDLIFGLANDVDIVALSFVRSEKDVLEIKSFLKKRKIDKPIIVKIETQEAMDNLDAILEVADGAMVARGDLAIEVPTELVPIYQKRIIKKCNELGKPVITATQMLESMISSPVPTRAEVSDIANSIYDGTDAIMLSEESTLGKYPEEAVAMMSRISETIEFDQIEKNNEVLDVADSISASIYNTAFDIDAKLIVALTESGKSAQRVSSFKSSIPVIALTPNKETVFKLNLSYGVSAHLIKPIKSIDEAIILIPKFLLERKLVKKGDKIVITAGIPFSISGSTNLVLVLTI